MPRPAIADATAIAGIGWTTFSKASGKSVVTLAAEASLAALADAGLTPADIDGVLTYQFNADTIHPRDLSYAIGIRNCNYQIFDQHGGAAQCAMIATAAMAVHAGICKHVLVFRATNGYSARRPSWQNRPAVGQGQWTAPFGSSHAAAKWGAYYPAYMDRYGATTADLAHVAVTERRHAALNTKALMRSPMTVEDHERSPWVIYPFRLFDCCLQTDGAAAVIVTTAERARSLRQPPVHIMSMIGGIYEPLPVTGWEIEGVRTAPMLYEWAGITPQDVDLAELYDPFTGMVVLHTEGFGLAPPGGAPSLFREGNAGLDGTIPINTHGGMLSEANLTGLNHIVEAVQQLRPGGVVDDLCTGPHDYDRQHCRQVRDPEIALVCGEFGSSALLLRRA